MNFFKGMFDKQQGGAGGEGSAGGFASLHPVEDGKIILTDGLGENAAPVSHAIEVTPVVSEGATPELPVTSEVVSSPGHSKEAGVDDVKNVFVEIHNEIGKLSEECIKKDAEIKDFVAQIEKFPRKNRANKVDSAKKKITALSSQADALLEKEGQLVDANNAESIQLGEALEQNTQLANDGDGESKQLMDEALLARKKERRDAFHSIVVELESLVGKAEGIIKSFEEVKKTSIQKSSSKKEEKNIVENISPEIGDLARSNGNLEILKKIKKEAIPMTETVTPVVKEVSKPVNPEVSAEFVVVLDEIQKEKIDSLNTVQTPESYVAFRKNKMSTPISGLRYFFDLKKIKDQVKRRLSNGEKDLVKSYEEELERKAQDKFLALMDADLRMQYDREQAKIDEVKDESALDELEIVWRRKLNIALTWESNKVIFDNLSEKEQKKVRINYLDCAAVLSQNLQIKREKFRRSRLEIKNQFNEVVREKKRSAKELLGDSPNEVLQGKYADHIRYLNRLGQDADSAFERKDIEELNRTLRAVNEVKFVVREEKKRDTRVMPEKRKEHSEEELFFALVKFLQPKLPFTFSSLGNGGKLVIVSASDGVIKYRQNENKAIIRIAPKNIKNFLQFLDNSFGWKLRMPREKEKKAVSVSAKPAPIATGKPEGAMPDVDPSKVVSPYGNLSTTTIEEPEVTLGAGEVESKNLKERLYEELETSVTKTKKKQYESVVTEGMAPFVEYMEQNPTLTLRAIINNDQYGGVENVARELAEELETILPNTWSDVDRKLFAFVFTKKQIEDLFE